MMFPGLSDLPWSWNFHRLFPSSPSIISFHQSLFGVQLDTQSKPIRLCPVPRIRLFSANPVESTVWILHWFPFSRVIRTPLIVHVFFHSIDIAPVLKSFWEFVPYFCLHPLALQCTQTGNTKAETKESLIGSSIRRHCQRHSPGRLVISLWSFVVVVMINHLWFIANFDSGISIQVFATRCVPNLIQSYFDKGEKLRHETLFKCRVYHGIPTRGRPEVGSQQS